MLTRLAAILATSLGGDPVTAAPGPVPATAAYGLQRMVPRGEARTIAFYASLFPDCSSQGPVVIRLLSQPRHGRVTVEEAQSFPQYAPSSPLAECNGRKVPGKRMVYQGEDGFEGLDSFRVLVINADGTGYESEVKVSVR
ncbi:hypothetical protein [Methylobacterium sp. J-076]|uniref:hypothetical protein n=1 Tax=Methylobacterium sp. J-076 TaxID=2836655 RepID=UPI001FB95BC5|nr:hypothetical protein [Methylobacterium sp. J-076]MCJ2012601.1 hypothetical protein [Methylobacterium sp. J-076]